MLEGTDDAVENGCVGCINRCSEVVDMRAKYGNVKFMVMNSYSTSADTLAFLEKYPELAKDESIEFLQNKVRTIENVSTNSINFYRFSAGYYQHLSFRLQVWRSSFLLGRSRRSRRRTSRRRLAPRIRGTSGARRATGTSTPRSSPPCILLKD